MAEEGSSNSFMSFDSRSVVDNDSFVAGSSLRENDWALTVLEDLEQFWFWDNIFNLATGPSLCNFGSCPNLEASPSSFRSIEMVSPRDSDKLSAMDLELDGSLHLLTENKVCSSGENVVHDGGEEPKVAEMPPSSTKASQQLPTIPRFSKLETIPSDKQLQEHRSEGGTQQTTVRRRERRRATRSMTDLEFDEVQGFMDLGFKFNMDELSPHVVSVLPGLQRLGGLEKTERHAQPPSRPYLSEAWLIRRPDSPLLNWRMPSLDEKGVDMKKQLKFWARAVACTVQQES